MCILAPLGQAALPGKGMVPAGTGGRGQLPHKAFVEQKPRLAAQGWARIQTGLRACSVVLQPNPH